MTARSNGLLLGLCGSLALCAACEDPVIVGPPPPAPNANAAATARTDGGVAGGGSALPQYRDDDFVEADVMNRDPFRNFSSVFRTRAAPDIQRRVILRHVSLDEMTLIAIVTGVPQPYAMLTDRDHVGYIVTRGDYLGRDEVVQTGGADGMPVTLNWRVDRIRENELVLTREDPTAPNRPPLVRVMTLRGPEEADTSRGGISSVGARYEPPTSSSQTNPPPPAPESPGAHQ